MRHRKKGRRLGRSSSHRKAMLRNLVTSLILTERDEDFYDGLYQSDGETPVSPPKYKGRVVTTLQKAKEARTLVEKCVTIARKAIKSDDEAAELETEAERNSDEWESWRKSDEWKKWVAARAPGVTARRRVFDILRDKEAVSILFEDIAPRLEDREGGYTRILKLAKPRLGDSGQRAILEFVGRFDRAAAESASPEFASDLDDDDDEEVTSESPEVTDTTDSDEEAVAEATTDTELESGAEEATGEDSDSDSQEKDEDSKE